MVDVDTVVIGSGAGGMAAAVGLAQAGHEVLVLEQHDTPGGWCHSFTLEGYRFSPGVHYIGECGPGGRMRAICEGMGVSGDLIFHEINPDGYDHAVIGTGPDALRFDIPKGREALEQRLVERFPSERRGVERYLTAVQRIGDQLDALGAKRSFAGTLALPWRSRTLLSHLPTTLERMLDRHGVRDPLCRAVLSIQAGDHGMTPSEAPAVLQAAVQHHYFHGGFYPRGGGFAIPRAFRRALERSGGALRLKSRVERILVEGAGRERRAIGVRLADGTEVRARQVVSNADPHVTFGRLLAPEHVPPAVLRRLKKLTYSTSAIALFMAVDCDVRAHGLDSGNYWFSRGADVEAMYRDMQTGGRGLDAIPGMFLTCTTLKDPSKKHRSGHHTLEAFAFVDYDAFARWAHTHFGSRPADYVALKQTLTDKMLKTLDDIAPGLSKHVVFAELGTPLTNEYYCEATRGNLYGTEKRLRQVGPWAFAPRTAIPGLYLCGSSTQGGHGVMGAISSGIDVVKSVLGCTKAEILNQRGPELKVVSAEDPASWPADLRRPTLPDPGTEGVPRPTPALV